MNAILKVLKNMPSVLEKGEDQDLLKVDMLVEQNTLAITDLRVEESSAASVSDEDKRFKARTPDDPLPNV